MLLSLKAGIGVGLALFLLMGFVAVHAALPPQHASAVGRKVSSPTETVIVDCGMYPLSIHESILNAKVPLESQYWMADRSELLQPHHANSVFTAPISLTLAKFSYVSWLNNGSSTSSEEFENSLVGRGTLAAGFNETTPPITDPIALNQLNHQLEHGDWLSGVPSTFSGSSYLLDWHVMNKTLMVIPVFDSIHGDIPDRVYHTQRYVTVRLLDFNLIGSNKYLKFALIDEPANYTCFRYDTPAHVGVPITFTPLMPVDPATTQVVWDFGDGTTSTAITATHTYTASGVYTVTLTHPQFPANVAIGVVNVDPVITPTLTPAPSSTPTLTLAPSSTPTLIPEPSSTPTLTPEPTIVPRWSIWIPSLRRNQ